MSEERSAIKSFIEKRIIKLIFTQENPKENPNHWSSIALCCFSRCYFPSRFLLCTFLPHPSAMDSIIPPVYWKAERTSHL